MIRARALLATEVTDAMEEHRKDDILYVVSGPASTVKTPLASPDHFQAMQITDAGVFYSRLTKWERLGLG